MTLEALKKRADKLAETATEPETVSIEKHGKFELVKWGRDRIITLLRGCSMDDL